MYNQNRKIMGKKTVQVSKDRIHIVYGSANYVVADAWKGIHNGKSFWGITGCDYVMMGLYGTMIKIAKTKKEAMEIAAKVADTYISKIA